MNQNADTLRVIVIGLGPIGARCARAIRREEGLELVGLLDIDPDKQGKTASEIVCGEPLSDNGKGGPRVTDDLDAAIGDGADVAVVTTTSAFDGLAPMLKSLAIRGLDVVSSCEEMAYPRYRHAALADEVDAAARDAGRSMLGAGVNPGFVMDALAVSFASMVRRVHHVRCIRRVDAALRRQPLQAKVGATMTVEHFNELADQGKIGHKGLSESVALLVAGLGRTAEPGSVVETLEPVVAEEAFDSALGVIEPGFVRGMRNVGLWEGDGLRVELDLTMAVGLADPVDKIRLDGPVQIFLKIPGSIPGDSATVAALVNRIRPIHAAPPGLLTMLDMPPAGCANRDRFPEDAAISDC